MPNQAPKSLPLLYSLLPPKFVIFLRGRDLATFGITALERFDGAFLVTADMGLSKEVEGNGVPCAL